MTGIGRPQIRERCFYPRLPQPAADRKALRTGRIGLIPYVSAEAFYDTRYDTFNEFRFTAGMEWMLARFLIVKSYFSRQRETTSSPEFINGLGITVQFYLHQKTRNAHARRNYP